MLADEQMSDDDDLVERFERFVLGCRKPIAWCD